MKHVALALVVLVAQKLLSEVARVKGLHLGYRLDVLVLLAQIVLVLRHYGQVLLLNVHICIQIFLNFLELSQGTLGNVLVHEDLVHVDLIALAMSCHYFQP